MPNDALWDSTTITGSDIFLSLGGNVIGTGTGLVLDVTRDKRPAYTFGSVDPRAIGRGIRQITGMMNAVNIKQSVVTEILSDNTNPIWLPTEEELSEDNKFVRGWQEYESMGERARMVGFIPGVTVKPVMLDELPPLELVLVGFNEAGLSTKMVVRGVEFTSVQWAITMDDVASAERVSFLARTYEPLSPVTPETE